MKNILKNKKVLICIISGIVIIVLILIILSSKKNDKLGIMQDAIENIFFYLPEEKYDNLNDMPDYCKISLVYGTDYLKYDQLLSTEDYDTVVNKEGKNSVKAYSTENILNSVKSVLGDNVSINFEQDEFGYYEFLMENGCGYENKYIDTLSYNETLNYVYSIDNGKNNSAKLYVKWEEPVIDGDIVTLDAKALLPLKNADGSYTVYADGNTTLIAGTIESGKNVDTEIEKLYDLGSRIYRMTLKKQGNDYIWTKYEVIDYIYNDEVIID